MNCMKCGKKIDEEKQIVGQFKYICFECFSTGGAKCRAIIDEYKEKKFGPKGARNYEWEGAI